MILLSQIGHAFGRKLDLLYFAHFSYFSIVFFAPKKSYLKIVNKRQNVRKMYSIDELTIDKIFYDNYLM